MFCFIVLIKFILILIVDAAEVKGKGSMENMERTVTETIEEFKHVMFSEAKVEVLEMFKALKVFLPYSKIMNAHHILIFLIM